MAVVFLVVLVAAVAAWAWWRQRPQGGRAEPFSLDRAVLGLWRSVVVLALVVAMGGFGLCGGMGVLGGVSSLLRGDSGGVATIGLGAIGLAIAWWLGRRAFKPSSSKETR